MTFELYSKPSEPVSSIEFSVERFVRDRLGYYWGLHPDSLFNCDGATGFQVISLLHDLQMEIGLTLDFDTSVYEEIGAVFTLNQCVDIVKRKIAEISEKE